jgi:hypothetical protein
MVKSLGRYYELHKPEAIYQTQVNDEKYRIYGILKSLKKSKAL